MTQKTFERVRRIELQLGVAPSHYEPAPARERRRADGETPRRRRETERSQPQRPRRARRPKSTRRCDCERA